MPSTLDLRSEARKLSPSVPNMPVLAAAARATWHARMVNEYGSHVVFAALADQMLDAGFDAAVVRECAGFSEEERRHDERVQFTPAGSNSAHCALRSSR